MKGLDLKSYHVDTILDLLSKLEPPLFFDFIFNSANWQNQGTCFDTKHLPLNLMFSHQFVTMAAHLAQLNSFSR